MLAPVPSAADLLAAFQRLMPRGEVWPRDPDAVQTQALSGLIPTMQRMCARAANLLTDAFPASTVELVSEWGSTLGLPDPCAGPNPVIAARQAAIVARLSSKGGQSIPYYKNIAASLGASITITEYAPFRAGINCAGQPLYIDAWANVWTVTVIGAAVYFFEAGVSSAGDPLWQVQQTPVQCEITRLAPGHTVVQFQAGAGNPFIIGESLIGGTDVLG